MNKIYDTLGKSAQKRGSLSHFKDMVCTNVLSYEILSLVYSLFKQLSVQIFFLKIFIFINKYFYKKILSKHLFDLFQQGIFLTNVLSFVQDEAAKGARRETLRHRIVSMTLKKKSKITKVIFI